jgi:endogenous inhibitor of DNA gyrase (YacG/DUF329 family)
VQVRCPRCERHVQWRGDTVRKHVARCAEADVTSINISKI